MSVRNAEQVGILIYTPFFLVGCLVLGMIGGALLGLESGWQMVKAAYLGMSPIVENVLILVGALLLSAVIYGLAVQAVIWVMGW